MVGINLTSFYLSPCGRGRGNAPGEGDNNCQGSISPQKKNLYSVSTDNSLCTQKPLTPPFGRPSPTRGEGKVEHVLKGCIFSLLTLSPAHARDFGVQGSVFPISELDPRTLIQRQLKKLEETGELMRHQAFIQSRVKESVLRPPPVKGLTRASVFRTFTIDPTYTCPRDIRDHKGRLLIKQGTRINPLETVSFSAPLVFFDGDDPDQRVWVLRFLNKPTHSLSKLILVKGSPLALARRWKRPVFFDQDGGLTKKLGLSHVPVVITQEGSLLRGEEILLSPPSQLTDPDNNDERAEKPVEKTQ